MMLFTLDLMRPSKRTRMWSLANVCIANNVKKKFAEETHTEKERESERKGDKAGKLHSFSPVFFN